MSDVKVRKKHLELPDIYKDDLQRICDRKNLYYRQNDSKSELVDLLMKNNLTYDYLTVDSLKSICFELDITYSNKDKAGLLLAIKNKVQPVQTIAVSPPPLPNNNTSISSPQACPSPVSGITTPIRSPVSPFSFGLFNSNTYVSSPTTTTASTNCTTSPATTTPGPRTTNNVHIVLKDYQREAVNDVNEYFNSNPKESACLVNMACGTGKTYVAAQLLKQCQDKGNNSAIFVPSQALATQIHERLVKDWGFGNVQLVMQDNPFDDRHSNGTIVVCVNPSASQLTGITFELIVLDEAHHMNNTDGWLGEIRKLKVAKKVFMTATPEELPDVLVNTGVLKSRLKTIVHYDLGRAIPDGHILDYVILYGDCGSNTNIVKHTLDFVEGHRYRRSHVISFSSYINDADTLLRATSIQGFQYKGPLHSRVTSVIDNLKKFRKASTGFLSAVQMGSEGIDIPNIDMAIFNTQGAITPVRVIQSLGRTLRIPEDGNRSPGVMRINQQQLVSVLEALIAHDRRYYDNVTNDFIRKHFVCCDNHPQEFSWFIQKITSLKQSFQFHEHFCSKDNGSILYTTSTSLNDHRNLLVVPTGGKVEQQNLSPDGDKKQQNNILSPVHNEKVSLSLPTLDRMTKEFNEPDDRRDSIEQGYLYCIMEDDAEKSPYFKIGRTVSPANRLSSIQTGNPRKVVGKLAYYVEHRLDKIETELKWMLGTIANPCPGGTEWFRFSNMVPDIHAVETLIRQCIKKAEQQLLKNQDTVWDRGSNISSNIGYIGNNY